MTNHNGAPEKIAEMLSDGEMNVTEIYTKARIEQPTASSILANMKNLGLVSCERRGKEVYYSLLKENWDGFVRLSMAVGGSFRESSDKLGAICKGAMYRRKVYEYIKKNQWCPVADIYNALGIEQSVCSQQLKILQDAGFVCERVHGKKRFKSITEMEANLLHSLATI